MACSTQSWTAAGNATGDTNGYKNRICLSARQQAIGTFSDSSQRAAGGGGERGATSRNVLSILILLIWIRRTQVRARGQEAMTRWRDHRNRAVQRYQPSRVSHVRFCLGKVRNMRPSGWRERGRPSGNPRSPYRWVTVALQSLRGQFSTRPAWHTGREAWGVGGRTRR